MRVETIARRIMRKLKGWSAKDLRVSMSRAENAELRAQRDELLAALKRAYSDATQFLNEGDFKRHVEWDAGYIVDAIDRAEGRKS